MLTRGVERNVGCHVRELIAMPGRGLIALKSRTPRDSQSIDAEPVTSLIEPYPKKRDTIKAPLSHFQGSTYAQVSLEIEDPSAPLTPSRALKVITLKTGPYEPLLKMKLPIDLSGREVLIPSILRALFKMRYLELTCAKHTLVKVRKSKCLMRAREDGPLQPSQSRPASRARLRLSKVLTLTRVCHLCRLMARLMAIDRRVEKW